MLQAFLDWRKRYKQYEPAIFFTAGFLFDVLSLRRIDDWLKLGFQIFFLILLGYFLILQYRSGKPDWQIPRALRKIWPYQIELVHFFFGSLLSAFAIFYFKSASVSRSVIFMALIIVLMIVNELRFVRKQGVQFRVILFSFCLTSFLIYFFPVLRGSMGVSIFLAAVIIATALTALLLLKMVKRDSYDVRRKSFIQMGIPSLAVNLTLVICYFLKVIPPVPLSMTFGGVYHKISKVNGAFELYSQKKWYDFWSHGDQQFLARNDEPVFCFVRVFAPAQFSHNIFLRWQLYDNRLKEFMDQDRIGMNIFGGRSEGFRGFAFKSHYQPGKWRVVVETDDGRPIGEIPFTLEIDSSDSPRVWMVEEG